jgi:hypothetical protein
MPSFQRNMMSQLQPCRSREYASPKHWQLQLSRWRQCVSLKLWHLPTKLYGGIAQTTSTFVETEVSDTVI